MKKTIILYTVFALLLTACGSTQTNLPQASDSLPNSTLLMLGTLKLEDTDQAVTAEQAKDLLVMWQVYQELISSDTAAQAEIDGLVEQIQETMTAEQMKSISAMNLTQQAVSDLMQEQGAGMGQVRQNSSSNGSTQSGGDFAPPNGGGMPGGAPPDVGGEMAGDVPPDGGLSGGPNTSTDQSQGTGAGSGAGGSTSVPIALVDALIQVLQQKVDAN